MSLQVVIGHLWTQSTSPSCSAGWELCCSLTLMQHRWLSLHFCQMHCSVFQKYPRSILKVWKYASPRCRLSFLFMLRRLKGAMMGCFSAPEMTAASECTVLHWPSICVSTQMSWWKWRSRSRNAAELDCEWLSGVQAGATGKHKAIKAKTSQIEEKNTLLQVFTHFSSPFFGQIHFKSFRLCI